jgi:uncharacterized protein (DUF58 family)
MTWLTRITDWLETRWVNPAYSGWLLSSLAIFLFIAATNTLAGWLYVMSGVMLALLLIAAILSYRNVRSLQIRRRPIEPVTVGDPLRLSLTLHNPTTQPKGLLQVIDRLPPDLGTLPPQVIETIPADSRHLLEYECPTDRRGIYRWQQVEVRTAAPFGLFWSRQTWPMRTIATVYPQILPLGRCPLIDEMGQDLSLQVLDNRRSRPSNEGITRSLRPYRWGDPMRMIHWSTSARHGELRVRELELMTSGREVLIALDSAAQWDRDQFEAAVTAATSLYFYGVRQQLNISLWTAATGRLRGAQQVLRVLAGVMPGEAPKGEALPKQPIVWLTQNIASLTTLPAGSRWLLWPLTDQVVLNAPPTAKGKVIDRDHRLTEQLQSTL